jgi:uncharacterized SAM-binding protein YcdF (DUF218 family)
MLSPESIDEITNFMFVPEEPLQANATIVFGMSLWRRPVEKAVSLYREGRAGRLVLTGGHNPSIGAVEAIEMWCKARELGVPDSDLLVESQATNTRENIANAHALLRASGQSSQALCINLVTINYHVRRTLLTFDDVCGAGHRLGVASYPSRHCPRDAWFRTEQGRKNVLGELAKIATYLPDRVPELLRQVVAGTPTHENGQSGANASR